MFSRHFLPFPAICLGRVPECPRAAPPCGLRDGRMAVTTKHSKQPVTGRRRRLGSDAQSCPWTDLLLFQPPSSFIQSSPARPQPTTGIKHVCQLGGPWQGQGAPSRGPGQIQGRWEPASVKKSMWQSPAFPGGSHRLTLIVCVMFFFPAVPHLKSDAYKQQVDLQRGDRSSRQPGTKAPTLAAQ